MVIPTPLLSNVDILLLANVGWLVGEGSLAVLLDMDPLCVLENPDVDIVETGDVRFSFLNYYSLSF